LSCDNAIIITSQEIDELKNQYLVPLVGVLGITTIFRREKTMNTVPTPTPTNLFPLSALGQNSAVDSFTIDALENRTVTGKHAHKILYKINVDSNLKVVDSHDVVFIAVRYTAGKPQPYEVYTRLCKAEDPTVKLFKSFLKL